MPNGEQKQKVRQLNEIHVQRQMDEELQMIPAQKELKEKDNIYHEKYHAVSKDMKFKDQSYYMQRSSITETERLLKDSSWYTGDSPAMKKIKASVDAITKFHTQPVFTQAQLADALQMRTDNQTAAYELIADMLTEKIKEYNDLVSTLIADCEDYIQSHNPRSPRGKKRLRLVQSLQEFVNEDHMLFNKSIGEVTSNLGEEKEELDKIMDGGSWISLLSYSRSIDGGKVIPFSAGNGASATTSRYEYKDKQYYRKTDLVIGTRDEITALSQKRNEELTEDENAQLHNVGFLNAAGIDLTEKKIPLGMRTVGTYRMAKYLGIEDCYVEAHCVREYNTVKKYKKNVQKTESSNDENPFADEEVQVETEVEVEEKFEEERAIIMEAAEGVKFGDIMKMNNTNPVQFAPKVKDKFVIMAINDFVCGQVDRHYENIICKYQVMADDNGNMITLVSDIKAIDSDLAFGLAGDGEVIKQMYGEKGAHDITYQGWDRMCIMENINYIPKDYFETLMSFDVKAIRMMLLDCGISDASFEKMQERLGYAREVFRKKYDEAGEKLFERPLQSKDIMKPKAVDDNRFIRSDISNYLNLEQKKVSKEMELPDSISISMGFAENGSIRINDSDDDE